MPKNEIPQNFTLSLLGAPLFKNAVIHLENGKQIVIEAEDNSDINIYIGRMLLDSKEYRHNYITHKQLTEGTRMKMFMAPQPNLSRGTADEDAPYSFSKEK